MIGTLNAFHKPISAQREMSETERLLRHLQYIVGGSRLGVSPHYTILDQAGVACKNLELIGIELPSTYKCITQLGEGRQPAVDVYLQADAELKAAVLIQVQSSRSRLVEPSRQSQKG